MLKAIKIGAKDNVAVVLQSVNPGRPGSGCGDGRGLSGGGVH